MRSPLELLKSSWQLVVSNFMLLLKFWAATTGIFLLGIAVIALIVGVAFAMKITWFGVLVGLLAIIPLIVVSVWLGAAGLELHKSIILKSPVTIKLALSTGWQNKGKYFSTSLLAGLAILGGFILLVIPGFIFGIMLAFCFAVLMFEGKSGTEAMGRSRELVKGRFWKTVGYLVVPTLVAIVISVLLSVVGSILHLSESLVRSLSNTLQSLAGIPFIFYTYLLYQEYVAHPVVKQ